MKRHLLKSKIMNAVITHSDLEYEGSLGIPKKIYGAVKKYSLPTKKMEIDLKHMP